MLQSKDECDSAAGIYHYKLWLPHGYLAQPHRYWPCVFIASPFGNARMGNMAETLKRTHVVVMLVESRNGPWPPTIGNFLAAHDDVVRRIRIREGRKDRDRTFRRRAGQFDFRSDTPGISPVSILQGAGVARDGQQCVFYFYHLRTIQSMLFAMVIGENDPRRTEISEMQHQIAPDHLAVLLFHGGHQWAPADSFAKALELDRKPRASVNVAPDPIENDSR